jgi:hypothetical protein
MISNNCSLLGIAMATPGVYVMFYRTMTDLFETIGFKVVFDKPAVAGEAAKKLPDQGQSTA